MLSISRTKTKFLSNFLLPNFVSFEPDVVRSIYMYISLSNVLFVEGGPISLIISFLFV